MIQDEGNITFGLQPAPKLVMRNALSFYIFAGRTGYTKSFLPSGLSASTPIQ